jgi:hypothetical protein
MGEVSIDLVFSLEEHPAALFSGHVSPQRGLQVMKRLPTLCTIQRTIQLKPQEELFEVLTDPHNHKETRQEPAQVDETVAVIEVIRVCAPRTNRVR